VPCRTLVCYTATLAGVAVCLVRAILDLLPNDLGIGCDGREQLEFLARQRAL
jgi:hypothetical protein